METRTVKISAEKNKELQNFLNSEGDGTTNVIETITASFEDGIEADIKVCDGESPFVDPVLFDKGNEICCLDVTDTLVGEYLFSAYMEKLYKVIVEVE